MKVFAIDTSTRSGSVAVVDDTKVVWESLFDTGVTHSELLLPSVKGILDLAGVSFDEMDVLALTLGPGSFTGVRIGVSTVKGFALVLGKPVVGVSTLEALASNFPGCAYTVVPLLDARKGEVYSAEFRWEGCDLVRVSGDRVIPPEVLLDEIDGPTLFVGDGTAKYGELIRERLGGCAILAPPESSLVRASVVARMAQRKYEKGDVLDADTFTPTYLRRSEAEINLEKGLLGVSGDKKQKE